MIKTEINDLIGGNALYESFRRHCKEKGWIPDKIPKKYDLDMGDYDYSRVSQIYFYPAILLKRFMRQKFRNVISKYGRYKYPKWAKNLEANYKIIDEYILKEKLERKVK